MVAAAWVLGPVRAWLVLAFLGALGSWSPLGFGCGGAFAPLVFCRGHRSNNRDMGDTPSGTAVRFVGTTATKCVLAIVGLTGALSIGDPPPRLK